MSELPRISVIVPSYNQARFIERTLRSVLDQGYPDLELIVMDGGSTDGTVEILRQYAGKLQWVSEKDEGQTDAINKGIRRCTGEIIAYLNSDDMYEPGTLARVAETFRSHPGVQWVTGRCRIIDEEDREVRRAVTAYKNLLLRRYSYSLLLVTNPVSQPATFLRRSVLDRCGLFDQDQHFVMDYEYWLRIGKDHPPLILDDYLADFRVYRTSKTSSSFLRSFRQEAEVARRYSSSKLLNALHELSYLAIASVYLALAFFGRFRRSR